MNIGELNSCNTSFMDTSIKLAIVGSRDYSNYAKMSECIQQHGYSTANVAQVISGGANGVDKMAERWAKEHNIFMVIHAPDYKVYGKYAPLQRNKTIAETCDHMIAFSKNKSSGTQHVTNIAKQLGKHVIVLEVM